MTWPLFPAFLKLKGRPVVLVGGGTVATNKLQALLEAGARVTVVAPEVSAEIKAAEVTIHNREFKPTDLEQAWLVVAAAPPDVNRRVAEAAKLKQLFVNAVDDPQHASVYLGGVVRRGGVTVAISTDGRAPALAGLIREAFERLLPESEVQRWLETADTQRAQWTMNAIPMNERRPLLWRALAALYDDRE
ncbi:MAG: bifunctional precorrin-2 dehydrogenase/sirohydrochlorin ferrochelatase [Acidobacteriota bacterium]|nr:bifunctional precorrin-2 dehydrogenase/sirohydrochlorin ferrochelatase [Acidobacteriota bacterium]